MSDRRDERAEELRVGRFRGGQHEEWSSTYLAPPVRATPLLPAFAGPGRDPFKESPAKHRTAPKPAPEAEATPTPGQWSAVCDEAPPCPRCGTETGHQWMVFHRQPGAEPVLGAIARGGICQLCQRKLAECLCLRCGGGACGEYGGESHQLTPREQPAFRPQGCLQLPWLPSRFARELGVGVVLAERQRAPRHDPMRVRGLGQCQRQLLAAPCRRTRTSRRCQWRQQQQQ